MEGQPVVCYSTGTMNSVLEKLSKLKNHSNPTDDFSVLIEMLKQDLRGLKDDFCDKISGQPAMHKQAKVCMKQVRDLVFNIEDWIGQELKTDLVVDRSVRQKFKYFEAKIHGARERFTRYFNLHRIVPTKIDAAPSKITINPRLLVEEKPCPDLLDGPRDELLKYLTDEKEEMRKVVSVVGMEGLGKTTLAKEVYSELQLRHQFQCQAFVTVGLRTSVRKTLVDILRQLKPWSGILRVNPRSHVLHQEVVDMQDIINELSEYLVTKRYFIIVDSIWSTWAWKVINCALPDNRGSRVLVTTCIIDVGRSCSSYPSDLLCQMEELNKKKSRILFISKTITLQQEEVWAGFEEDSCYILKICGGMPLAITVAASLLLARKSRKLSELKVLGESIYSSLKQNSFSEGLTKILHMIYADLSLPLRSCFLYLCVFPDNYMIKKDRLIRLWGAEGFIPKKDKECLWVTGEMYFNELISRRLIEPVFNCDDDQAVGCTVHTVLLDFIRSLSREENFATRATELNSGAFPCDTIRRLSLDCGNEHKADTLSTNSVHLSGMRSLIVLGDGMHAPLAITVPIINLLPFKLLRVLDLEDIVNLTNYNLPWIGELVLLRYLGLAGSGICSLPDNIGKLEELETLDLRRNGHVWYFPASVAKLKKLTHLLLDEVDATKIWEMQELDGASDICVQNSSSLDKVAELLRNSERLRMLSISLRTSLLTETDLVSFLDKIAKSNLQSLSLYSREETIALLVDSWEKVSAPLEKKFVPRRFELKISLGIGEQVPHNMGSLDSLTHLHIQVGEVRAQDFHVLGGLTNLVLLNLISFNFLARGSLIIKKGIFPGLKVFSYRTLNSSAGLEFEEGAMPQLQRLGRSLRATPPWGAFKYPDIGVEHLTCLTRVHATINCYGATVSEVEGAEAAIRAQVHEITAKPLLELGREEEQSMREGIQWETFRRQLSEESMSIPQLEDADAIRETEGQDTIFDPCILESSIEDEDQMCKDKGRNSARSKKQVFLNAQKRVQIHRSISSLILKIKDKLIGPPKVFEDSSEHVSEWRSESRTVDYSSIDSEGEEKYPPPYSYRSIKELCN